jgi:hypothetical protein
MSKDNRKYSDRADYLKMAVAKRRKMMRTKSLEYKGGKCELCGYATCMNALEFHHIDDMNKDFGISARGYTRSWDTVKKELDKTILVCANCHREVHSGITQLP